MKLRPCGALFTRRGDNVCFACGIESESFSLNDQNPFHSWLRSELDFDIPNFVRRRIVATGKSKPFIRPVSENAADCMCVCRNGHITSLYEERTSPDL